MNREEKWLKTQIRDEKKSAKMYRAHGLPNVAKDETKHRKILERRLEKLRK